MKAILPLIVLALAARGMSAEPAVAQLIDTWAGGTGVPVDEFLPSARLQAMGGMQVAVADENREIHLWDFARNLTGLLNDKPVSYIEVYAGPRNWKDQTTVELGDQNFKSFPASFYVNLKPNSMSVLGGGFRMVFASTDRLVNDDLRRTFVLPLEQGEFSTVDNEVYDAAIQAPLFSAHYVRQLTDRLAFGVEWSYLRQDERKGTTTIYKIEHVSGTQQLHGGLAYEVVAPRENSGFLRGLVLGATGLVGRTRIDGESLDDVHHDTFDWERPEVGASIHAIGQLGGDMKAGLDFRYSSFEGQETVQYNWSELFVMNPTPLTLETNRATFEEGRRYKGMEARWEKRSARSPIYLAGAFSAFQEEYWQSPGLNVNSFLIAKNLQLTSWKAVGGGGYYLDGGRGQIAGEFAYGLEDLDQRITVPTVTTPTSTLELGVGGEYFPYLKLGLRGGYRRILFDGDRDLSDSTPDETTDRFAVGVAYRTPDGRWLIDAGFMYDKIEIEDPDPEREDQDRRVFTLQSRWLL